MGKSRNDNFLLTDMDRQDVKNGGDGPELPENELFAALRLQHIPNLGDISAKKLIAHCGSPAAVFTDKMQVLLKIDRIGSAMLSGLHDPVHARAAERELNFIRKHRIGYYYYRQHSYPYNLQHCPDGPVLLFYKGNIELEGKKIISVVGTRNMTGRGRDFCHKFIEDLAVYEPVIISGFAYGVDICVQRAAMAHGLQTIGCLAHGLNRIYPPEHRIYADMIMKNGGFFTEQWSKSLPVRENFLRRNRIIAGLSQATVVIESGEKGGSLVTANLAAEYNREVFAVPGRTTDVFSRGCNALIRSQKAHLLTAAEDLVYMLNWEATASGGRGVQKQLFVDLNPVEQRVVQFLEDKGKQHLDEISIHCDLPVSACSALLFELEMKGVICPLPGKLFELA
ncbi:DNA-processing protein DprA [Zeaxanthinibacter enoshimensis]|uniref:DNA processing protein n=1 Tax=Zeaxanthinibacter enoshimensis TaxID=392009 RepID=A0A4R6TMJ2_9FLAO|nr:DNA-processing protein DprA [Zeaxanthinibacter enoshimensis]TDQ32732.1 DNA processing protein [Zeaxanthinibacter enoshimensis]